MRYMFLIYSQEKAGGLPPQEFEKVMSAHRAVMDDASSKGILLGVAALKPTVTATTVRVKDSRPVTLDGPFAETKEQLAGYYILECKDLDEALEWAKRIPSGCEGEAGCIEVRPIAELPPPQL